ncbi:MAG: cell division protein FtsX [Alphaproteobacteria bacterium]
MALRSSRSLPMPRDAASRFLPWIVALMVFLAALALAAVMLLGTSLDRWQSNLTGTLTVQVPAGDDPDATDAAVARIVELLAATPGVEAAQALSRERLAALVAPWLGDTAEVPDLPMPRLVDVRLRPGAHIDLAMLGERLAAIATGTSVDDHQVWLGRLVRYARALEATAFVVLGLVTAVWVITVLFVTLTRMSIHRAVIALLHLMGATDAYIARQFQRHALRFGLGGGVLGVALAAAALLALDRAAADLATPILPLPRLTPEQWAVLGILPLVTALIAMLTARLTVLVQLKRMP